MQRIADVAILAQAPRGALIWIKPPNRSDFC